MKLRIALCLVLASATANAAPATPGGVAVVERLYRDYAWEAVMAPVDDAVGLMQEPRATLERYFDPALADLIAKDAECAARTQEICNLDFAPMWSGQDPGASDLTVTATADPAKVRVRFDSPGDEEPIELTYTVAEGASGWRITDIAGDGWDLRELLQRQP